MFLSLGQIVGNFPNIRIFSMADGSGIGVNTLTSGNATTCPAGGSTCKLVVRFLKLYINPSNNQVDQSLSYVIVGSLQGLTSFPAYIIVKYDYIYLNSDGSFANVSNIGYKIGSSLQLIKKQIISTTTTNYHKTSNPINLAFRKPNGDCAADTDTDVD